MGRIGTVLFWAIIAAAFIGPGTVATAASAGAVFGHSLLWALVFSTLACLLLQEAAARLTIVSGRDLGSALREQYRGGWKGAGVLVLVLGAIVVGCAAYQAGNILGGVAGAGLGVEIPRPVLTLCTGAIAATLLWAGAPRTVARLLGLVVAVMGVAFLFTAWRLGPSAADLLKGSLTPSMPAGSGVLVLGLVGTTVVPYNLFLGSGLARGQTLSEVRFGLTVAILLGGVISMGIVVVGTAVDGAFDFEALAGVLEPRLGGWARSLFALGLFCAGLSSAVTAPLAAAVTARSVLAGNDNARWGDRSWRFRAVWAGVLGVGVAFGLAEVRPVPAILIAQALNGILLPVAAIFLWLAVNDRMLMGERSMNGVASNVAMACVVGVTLLLGTSNVARAVSAALALPRPDAMVSLAGSSAMAVVVGWPLARRLVARRRSD